MSNFFLYGVGAFILISLWVGSHGDTKHAASQSDTEDTVPLRFPLALTPTDSQLAAAQHINPETRGVLMDAPVALEAAAEHYVTERTSEAPSFDDDDERRYETYATYEYTRPRDAGNSNTYSYRVKGRSEDGVQVTGSVDTRGTYGEGILATEDGKRVWVTTTWSNDGDLTGRDENGTTYELSTRAIR